MVGRKQEADELRRLYERNRAELVAVYGRRRVGKTFWLMRCLRGNLLLDMQGFPR